MSRRAIMFIDGFNLYHSLNDYPVYRKYKWLDLWRFSDALLLPNDTLTGVLYFTAYTYWNPARQARHEDYVAINRARGCTVVLGNFQKKTRHSAVPCGQPCVACASARKKFCGKPYDAHEEKKTDVNIAVHIIKKLRTGKMRRGLSIIRG